MPRDCGLTRITIVEDHVLFAEALDIALTIEGHLVHRVSLEEPRLRQHDLFETIIRTRPRVVLLDLDLGEVNGSSVVQPLTAAGVAVLVVTATRDEARWGEVLSYGARTVLPKSTPLNTILASIRLIAKGKRLLPREERDRLLMQFHEERGRVLDSRARLDTLTRREREILDRLTNGETVREIARTSFVSEATVRSQVKSILAKLGVSSQLAAVSVALRAGRGSYPATRTRTSA